MSQSQQEKTQLPRHKAVHRELQLSQPSTHIKHSCAHASKHGAISSKYLHFSVFFRIGGVNNITKTRFEEQTEFTRCPCMGINTRILFGQAFKCANKWFSDLGDGSPRSLSWVSANASLEPYSNSPNLFKQRRAIFISTSTALSPIQGIRKEVCKQSNLNWGDLRSPRALYLKSTILLKNICC